jgi:hypothetical protein
MSRRAKKAKKNYQNSLVKKNGAPSPQPSPVKEREVKTKLQTGLSVRVLGRPRIELGKKTMADVVVGKEELIEKKLLQAKEQAAESLTPEKIDENLPLKKVMETQAEIEKNKRLIMWSGIAFFMIIIIFGWFYNTKKVFEANRLEKENQPETVSWDERISEIGNKITEMKDTLEAVKSLSDHLASSTESITASSTPDYSSLPETDLASSSEEESGTLSDEEIKELKDVLEKKASQKIKIVY